MKRGNPWDHAFPSKQPAPKPAKRHLVIDTRATDVSLDEARAMAAKNDPLPEEFFIDQNGDVQFKPGVSGPIATIKHAGGLNVTTHQLAQGENKYGYYAKLLDKWRRDAPDAQPEKPKPEEPK
jgi:hypothetical protein